MTPPKIWGLDVYLFKIWESNVSPQNMGFKCTVLQDMGIKHMFLPKYVGETCVLPKYGGQICII